MKYSAGLVHVISVITLVHAVNNEWDITALIASFFIGLSMAVIAK